MNGKSCPLHYHHLLNACPHEIGSMLINHVVLICESRYHLIELQLESIIVASYQVRHKRNTSICVGGLVSSIGTSTPGRLLAWPNLTIMSESTSRRKGAGDMQVDLDNENNSPMNLTLNVS